MSIQQLIQAESEKRSKMSASELADDEAERQRTIAGFGGEFEKLMSRFAFPDTWNSTQAFRQHRETVDVVRETMFSFHQFVQQTTRALRGVEEAQKLFDRIRKASQFDRYTQFFEFEKRLKELPKAFRAAQKRLWASGWMIHREMPLPGLQELVDRDDLSPEEVDEALRVFFNECFDEMESDLVKDYPRRRTTIEQCFETHRQKLYCASIPLAFSLADGIFGEIVGLPTGLYSKGRNGQREVVKTLQSRLSNGSGKPKPVSEFLLILDDPGPVNAGKTERTEFRDPFNRHLVMHGHNTDYGTELNSLKAISLLNFVGTFLAHYRPLELSAAKDS